MVLVAAIRRPSSLTSSGGQSKARKSSRRRRCGCGSEKSQVPPASQLSPSRHSRSSFTAVPPRTSSIVFRFMSAPRGVVELSGYRLLQRDHSTRTLDPGPRRRRVSCDRALSHATTLIPFKIRNDNERLRPVELKCDATLHPKSAKRKRTDRVWDLTMQQAGVACRQDSI